MLEELCRNAFYSACREECPIVKLKSQPKSEFDGFFTATSSFTDWNWLPMRQAYDSKMSSILRMAWVWFNENGDAICTAYIPRKYGDIRTAMRDAGSFDVLLGNFKKDFAERRMQFMEKSEMSVPERPTGIAKRGRSPQSHGGVANLLKVLTKTMHDQGSTIETIAKIQYAVCMQAGIYIPDEFLTDVLVAKAIVDGADQMQKVGEPCAEKGAEGAF